MPDPQHDGHNEDERDVGAKVGVFIRVKDGLRSFAAQLCPTIRTRTATRDVTSGPAVG